MELKIELPGARVRAQETIQIIVTRKKIKSVRLKVYPSLEVKISVPIGTPDEWIERFVKGKKKWIEEKLQLFAKTKAVEKETNIKSGVSTRILGRQMKLRVFYAKQKRVAVEDLEVHLHTNCPEDQAAVNRQFENWWRKNARQYFTAVMKRLYPVVKKHGIGRPNIFVRKMKTLWGSCSRTRGRVNLNYYLYKAPVPCIEYVILHELTHFLYPYHNKDFYDFLTIHMPDWKERKKQLDYEIVLGL